MKSIFVVAIFLVVFTNLSNCEIIGLECVLDPGEDILVDCPSWEEGTPTYFPFPDDCRKFIVCTNGDPIVQCCAPGTVWDNDASICNHESVTPCVIVTTPRPTTPTTTEPPNTTENLPIEPGQVYRIVNYFHQGALEIYNSSVTNLLESNATSDVGCSNLGGVWKLEMSGSSYHFRSVLSGRHAMYACHIGGSTHPCIFSPDATFAWEWSLTPVNGSKYWIIRKLDVTIENDTLTYTSIDNGSGINVELYPLNPEDPAQWWEFRQC